MTVPATTSAINDASAALDFDTLRRGFGQFPQGVVAIAAELDGHPEVLVASTFTVGVSLSPPLVTFAVQRTSTTWPRLNQGARHLGVSVIGRDKAALCRQMSSKDRDSRFQGVSYGTDNGAVLLENSPLTLTTRIYDQHPAGDHDIVLLEILDMATSNREGLVFHQSQFKGLSPLNE